jgi:hypothetical protein
MTCAPDLAYPRLYDPDADPRLCEPDVAPEAESLPPRGSGCFGWSAVLVAFVLYVAYLVYMARGSSW